MRQQLRDQSGKVAGCQQNDFKVLNEHALEENLRMSYTRQSGIEKLGDYINIETFPNSPANENPLKAPD